MVPAARRVYGDGRQTVPLMPMNSTITFPARSPALKLPRSSTAPGALDDGAASLAEALRRLEEDNEALRVREENLRDYEARLRVLQDEIAGGGPVPALPLRTATPFLRPSSKAPFENDAALQAAWEKLHRARELLEAEQTHLRDERIVTQEKERAMTRREQAVGEREARVAAREQAVAAAEVPVALPAADTADPARSAGARFTLVPFNVARAVFGGKK